MFQQGCWKGMGRSSDMKNMSRAIRRHHIVRLKHNRKHYWSKDVMTPIQQGKVSQYPKPCSCVMCGNERKHFKSKTIQEKRFLQEPVDIGSD